jgi:hypothetical protein
MVAEGLIAGRAAERVTAGHQFVLSLLPGRPQLSLGL